jgi:hypothetical protein
LLTFTPTIGHTTFSSVGQAEARKCDDGPPEAGGAMTRSNDRLQPARTGAASGFGP